MVIRPAIRAGDRPSRVVDTALDAVSVRPARLDRPLRRSSLDPTYSDPHLEELVRVAADRARNEARAEGYAAGWSQGRQAAAAKAQADSALATKQAEVQRLLVNRDLAELMNALSAAARDARLALTPDWTEVADTLAAGALRLAEAALGRELSTIDDAIAQAVKNALHHLTDPGDAVVHLNPADAALVLDNPTIGIRVISDPRVPVGSITVLTPAQRLRHDLPAALDAAEDVLRS